MDSLPLFIDQPTAKSVEDSLSAISETGLFAIHSLSVDNDLMRLIYSARPCVCVLSLGDHAKNLEVIHLLEDLKKWKRADEPARDPLLRILLVAEERFPAKHWADLGVHEFILAPIRSRSLSFKLSRHHLKIIAAMGELKDHALLTEEIDLDEITTTGEWRNFLNRSSPSNDESRFHRIVFRAKSRLLPDPREGMWIASDVQSHEHDGIWEWRAKPGKVSRPENPSHWSFKGDLPTYDQRNEEWVFAGEVPRLSTAKNGGISKDLIAYSPSERTLSIRKEDLQHQAIAVSRATSQTYSLSGQGDSSWERTDNKNAVRRTLKQIFGPLKKKFASRLIPLKKTTRSEPKIEATQIDTPGAGQPVTPPKNTKKTSSFLPTRNGDPIKSERPAPEGKRSDARHGKIQKSDSDSAQSGKDGDNLAHSGREESPSTERASDPANPTGVTEGNPHRDRGAELGKREPSDRRTTRVDPSDISHPDMPNDCAEETRKDSFDADPLTGEEKSESKPPDSHFVPTENSGPELNSIEIYQDSAKTSTKQPYPTTEPPARGKGLELNSLEKIPGPPGPTSPKAGDTDLTENPNAPNATNTGPANPFTPFNNHLRDRAPNIDAYKNKIDPNFKEESTWSADALISEDDGKAKKYLRTQGPLGILEKSEFVSAPKELPKGEAIRDEKIEEPRIPAVNKDPVISKIRFQRRTTEKKKRRLNFFRKLLDEVARYFKK